MAHKLTNMQTQRVAANHSIGTLAKKASLSDFVIQQLENGGACTVVESQKISDALGVSLATLGKVEHSGVL